MTGTDPDETPLDPSDPVDPVDPVTPTTSTRYFGWSDDQVIETSDLAAADTSTTNSGTLPARTSNGYVFVAVAESRGQPAGIRLAGSHRTQRVSRQAGTIDDTGGDPLIVVYTARQQAPAIAGEAIEVVF